MPARHQTAKTGRRGQAGGGRERERDGIKPYAARRAAVVGVAGIVALGLAAQLGRGVAAAKLMVALPARAVVPGTPVRLPWPSVGSAALAIEGVGGLGGVRADAVVPLASVTKLVTALVVLAQHPLAPGQSGPAISFSAADASAYRTDLGQDQSVLAVAAGEKLTELQALEAMLIPSADNVARVLARWTAGSETRFVAEMNREAVRLDLRGVHFVGPSGLNPGSVGTAAAMVRLGAVVMANPVLRRIVSMPSVTLPVAGTVTNYNSVLGQQGIVGVKTGSTSAAGGNFVFAAIRRLGRRRITIIGAVLGARGADPLQTALDDGVTLTAAAVAAVHPMVLLPAGSTVGRIRSGWASPVAVRTLRPLRLDGVAGRRVSLRVVLTPSARASETHGFGSGVRLARVMLSDGQQQASVAAVAASRLAAPSLLYRLTRL